MFYKICPDCGCALDPGERCDCRDAKKEGPPDTTQASPSDERGSMSLSVKSISQKEPPVNSNLLRFLRISRDLNAGEMVRTVQEMYPGYDRSLQAKCENGERYGIDLKTKAMDALLSKYAPEMLEAERHRRDGRHKLKKRVSCRLTDFDYDSLIERIKNDGFETVQDCLTWLVRNYLKGNFR